MYILRDWVDPAKLSWPFLSGNVCAFDFLKDHPEKINWFKFSENPAIFEYDYKNMSRPFTEELMAKRFHPDNMDKFDSWGF